MYWPSAQDYNEAVQTALTSFTDQDLKGCEVETTALGLPRCVSGNFASVYCFKNDRQKFALRCFLQNIPDQERRYKQISDFVQSDDLPYTVQFEYIKEGIKVRGAWYPILKMQWIDGITLNQFVESSLGSTQSLKLMASYFKQMTIELHRAGIAHGDLQHDNILIADDELRLVDYDGMFVPALSHWTASELGHRNYQHPGRTPEFFAPSLDNFSSWIIYNSLKILALDPSLWNSLQGGDDCLLFKRDDFTDSEDSARWQLLLLHDNQLIRSYAAQIRRNLAGEVANIPPIDAEAVGHSAVMVRSKPISTNLMPANFSSSEKALTPVDPTLPFVAFDGYGSKDNILKVVHSRLMQDESIIWSGEPLNDDRPFWNGSFFIVGLFALFTFLFVPSAGVVAGLLLMLLCFLVRNRFGNPDRMYVVTTDQIMMVQKVNIAGVMLENISLVEESAIGATLVLKREAGPLTAIEPVRRTIVLDDEQSREGFFAALPGSVRTNRW